MLLRHLQRQLNINPTLCQQLCKLTVDKHNFFVWQQLNVLNPCPAMPEYIRG